MNYSDAIHIARYYFPVITAIFFVMKLIGGESKDRKHSLIICCVCALYFMIDDIDSSLSKIEYREEYIEALFIIILIAGAGMMSMFSMVPFDGKAFKHSLILAFIILINSMLTWHYTVSPQPLLYSYFDELIIIASIIQIMVSCNGIMGSISRIVEFFRFTQRSFVGFFVSCVCRMGNPQKNKKSEG